MHLNVLRREIERERARERDSELISIACIALHLFSNIAEPREW